ncbi:MAG: hypothetical protein ACRDVL_09955 [Acidimicrobiia bacterium]
MSITLSPAKAHFLEQVSAGLGDLPEEERDEVVQDLSAHLAELSDDEIVSVLGAPAAFVAEFRASAGLDRPGRLTGLLGVTRARLESWSTRLSYLTRWPRVRQLWVWTRGWLVLSMLAAIEGGVAFYRFPIPAIGDRTAIGLMTLAGATWLSVWLDQRPGGHVRKLASAAYSAFGIWALAAGLLGAFALGRAGAFIDPQSEVEMYGFPIVGQNGVQVENIYAYDLEGNPIEVLLFDQLGRPLLVMPPWVYEEAELRPGQRAVEYPGGYVIFSQDEFGRVIPNLYPLQLDTYNDWGELRPAQPPGGGSMPDEEGTADPPPTTTADRFGD